MSKKTITFHDNIVGSHILKKCEYGFETCITWCGLKIRLYFEGDSDEEISELFNIAHELIKNQDNWDSDIKKYIVSTYLDTANEWRDEITEQLTGEELIELLNLESMGVYKDKSFFFGFYDEVIFYAHSTGKHDIDVYGSLEEGIIESDVSSRGSIWFS